MLMVINNVLIARTVQDGETDKLINANLVCLHASFVITKMDLNAYSHVQMVIHFTIMIVLLHAQRALSLLAILIIQYQVLITLRIH